MPIKSPEARGLATILCREVLDILNTNEIPDCKLTQISKLIESWVTTNGLPIGDVKRVDGAYTIRKAGMVVRGVGEA